MTIELDTTLAQAEVLFLSFAQLVADIDRRTAEQTIALASGLRRRGPAPSDWGQSLTMPPISENLRELLKAGRP